MIGEVPPSPEWTEIHVLAWQKVQRWQENINKRHPLVKSVPTLISPHLNISPALLHLELNLNKNAGKNAPI